MGNTCISMADSCQCMTKTTKKKNKKQNLKITLIVVSVTNDTLKKSVLLLTC